MAVDLSLIPQNRVAELVSKLSSIDSSISTINTNITTNNNNAVHKTGNETIDGVKTFTSDLTLQQASVKPIFKSTGYTKGTAPTDDTYMCYNRYLDKNGASVFSEYYYVQKSTNTNRYILRFHNVSSASATGYTDIINAYFDGTTSTYTVNATTATAPTPATSDSSSKIATTAFVKSILSTLYPVGSTYITTASTCPLATLISGSTWELVSSGRVLQGADSGHSAGTTIEAGVPNITGTFVAYVRNYADKSQGLSTSGAFTESKRGGNSGVTGSNCSNYLYTLNASRSSSIYGKSSTVQPPAYVVNIFRRTA